MADGPNYKVRYHRRDKGVTNYRKRLKYLISGNTMLVVRNTNKYIIGQIVKYSPKGDIVVYGTSSTILKKYGVKKSFHSTPAAYLTGLIIGKKVKSTVSRAILNTGLANPIKGGRTYALVKGVIDAGIEIPHDPKILPKMDRIKGEHLKEKIPFEEIKRKIEGEVQ
ncbi:MAG: 50S ribosomal protein L18 [Thermoplasmata archaeon]